VAADTVAGNASIPGAQAVSGSVTSYSSATSTAATSSARYGRSPAAAQTETVSDSSAQQAFIDQVAPGALAAQKRYGIPAAVTIAQAIDESGWGQSLLATQDNNLFGIKGTGPAGSVLRATEEYVNGQPVTISAPFRVYSSLAQSIADHSLLLATGSSYKQAMADRGSADTFANDLTGVYATDPNYGASLITLMQQYSLYRYDAGSPAAGASTAASPSGSGATGSGQGSAASGTAQGRATSAGSTSGAASSGTVTSGTVTSGAVTSGTVTSSTGTSSTAAAGSTASGSTAAGTVSGASHEGAAIPGAMEPNGAVLGGAAHQAAGRSAAGHGSASRAAAGGSTTGSPAAHRGTTAAGGAAGRSDSGAASASSAAAAQGTAAGQGMAAGQGTANGQGAVGQGTANGQEAAPAAESSGQASIPGVVDGSAGVAAMALPVMGARLRRNGGSAVKAGPRNARISTRRYLAEVPRIVTTDFIASAKTPLRRSEPIYREVASGHGLQWELLAACDWMQCQAQPRLSPVYGEPLGAKNPDGTVYRSKSEALDQVAADLIELAAVVYGINVRQRLLLSVRELANVFAAFRWGGLLKAHRISAMEFPYSVEGLTAAHLKMRWPDIPGEAPDKPGTRFRRPFGAVPVVLGLDYPAVA
jgi:flagellum-specific peptidoglycan hydrolase FlgJ